ncbi:MAG TPA: primosomal protein N' [Bacteroidales bacterium]|nr:primosomal protein N' [Bacteroidales bacterium]HPT21143.1 primosomal protein N' [Bacteroidales bacterium]
MTKTWFADIILPLAVRGRFTYRIPDDMLDIVKPGVRVKVRFGGQKLSSGIVCSVHNKAPLVKNVKPVIEVLDAVPAINESQLKLWLWISEYYLCSEGEVMKAALPSEASLDNYRPRTETFIKLANNFSETELNSILDTLGRAPKQYEVLASYITLSKYEPGSESTPVSKSLLLSESHSSTNIVEALVGKGILSSESMPVSRLTDTDSFKEPVKELSAAQAAAYESVKNQLNEKDIVLLHGVTSSGKTEIYIHLIEEQLKKGKQVLYMLPEIALTTQIIMRLKKHFGAVTGVYHSRFSDPEKVEIWKKVADNDTVNGFRLILGVRSSLFLPFSDLGLIIVDEEHDSSYKQQDPAPRYHARDSAIMLASIHKAKTILGSASPSVESYNNAVKGKYGLAELKERYGLIKMPEIIIGNTREAYRKKLMISHFTPELLTAMDEALGKDEQIILFQNRRGFSPYIECSECGWIPTCIQCAVNLTYHKGAGKLICHYCGYTADLPSKCGNCHSSGMVTRGFGTEKIEDEIKIVFPKARVARMDQDTTRNKNSFNKIIKAFEKRQIDILIGTQMISKGLDFENLTVVGVLNADNLLNYPDFRAHERSFQLMEQVSGRAGRRQKQGKVVIQTSDPANRIIRLVLRHDYINMFRMQAEERMTFNYPPFCRMVKIIIRHKDRSLLNHYSDVLGNDLKGIFGKRVLGPESPVISQVQLWYIKTILIKIERNKPPVKAKQLVVEAIGRLEKEKGASSLKIAIDVDPY